MDNEYDLNISPIDNIVVVDNNTLIIKRSWKGKEDDVIKYIIKKIKDKAV